MKKLLLSIIVFSLVLSGCTPASQSKANINQDEPRIKYAECLTLGDSKTALAREDLQLIENREESPAYYQLDYAMPAIFNIKDSNQIILIYVFNTIADREQVCQYGGSGRFPIDISQKGNYYPFHYEWAARNILFIDLIKKFTPQDMKPMDEQVFKFLPQVMLSLNDSHKVIYKDRGTYWDAKCTVDYYQNWYKDERGTTLLDQYSKEKLVVKYIGTNALAIQDIKYEFKTPSGSMSGDGYCEKIGDSYYFRLGGEHSNIPDINSVLTMTIKWDGKEESLKLRASQKFLKYLPNKSWGNFVNE